MAMRQSSSHSEHLSRFQKGKLVDSGYIPTTGERAKELCRQGPNALCNLSQKKSIARECLQLKVGIMNDANAAANGSDLPIETEKFFLALKNRNTIKNMPNATLASLLSQFTEIVTILNEHILQLELAKASTMRMTRQGANEKQKSLSAKELLYKSIIGLKKKIDATIRLSINNAGADTRNYLVTGIKLESSMVGRSFNRALVPTDPGHWKCIYCGCFSINTVPEDDGLIERNDILISNFEVLDKVWKTFQQAKEQAENAGLLLPSNPTNPFNGNTIRGRLRHQKATQLNLLACCVVA